MKKKKYNDTLLRCLRQANGKTSDMLAETSGVNRQIVYRAEQQEAITTDSANKIAHALGINSDIMFYHMGKLPPDKIEFVKKDPLFFMQLIEGACSEPWKLVTTKEFMEEIKAKINEVKTKEQEQERVNPEIDKMLSRIKPTK